MVGRYSLSARLSNSLAVRGGGVSLRAFSPIKQKIVANAEDVTILVIGDSTGNESSEWAYLFADWLGDQYPTHTVDYYLWSDGSSAYDAGTELSAGSGARTISFYNCSVSGAATLYIQGARFSAAVGAIDADLVIWNHGHNHVSGNTQELMQGEISGALDQVRLALPNANHAAFIQNPRRDDSLMALANTVWRSISAQWADLLLLDAYSRFIDAGKPSGWYTDNQHPNATGQAVILDVIQDAWNASGPGAFAPSSAWFATEATNLLTNGALASTGTDAPTGWTVTGTLAFAREETIVYPGYDSSLKLNGSGAAQARISQQVTGSALTPLKGGYVFLVAVGYVPTGADATVGRIAVSVNGTGGGTFNYRAVTTIRDGWALYGVGPVLVPSDATALTCILYHDTDSSPDTDPVYWQRACLVAGSVPRDFP